MRAECGVRTAKRVFVIIALVLILVSPATDFRSLATRKF